MPLLDPCTVPAAEVHTDARPLGDLVPCDVQPQYHPDGDCPTPYHCPTEET